MARLLCLWLAVVLLLSVAVYAADVTVNGYIQYEYVAKQIPKETTGISTNFGLRAARIKASCKLNDKISAYVLIDGAKQPSVLEANLDYICAPFLTVRLGQFQLPFGYETQNSNFDVEAIDRSQIVNTVWNNGTLANGIGNGYLRDQGLMLMGQHTLFNYKVACVNGTGLNTADNNNYKDIVGRIGVGIPMFAGLGVSLLHGEWPNGLKSQDRKAIGVDLFLDTGKVLVESEFIAARGMVTSANTALDKKFGGYYAIVGYRVTPLIEPVFKYDKMDNDKDNDADATVTTNTYLGVNLNFEGKARLQVFYKIASETPSVDNNQVMVSAKAKF
ncbi:MAG TPA: porin [bacterium]|nr:porin [bacterium]